MKALFFGGNEYIIYENFIFIQENGKFVQYKKYPLGFNVDMNRNGDILVICPPCYWLNEVELIAKNVLLYDNVYCDIGDGILIHEIKTRELIHHIPVICYFIPRKYNNLLIYSVEDSSTVNVFDINTLSLISQMPRTTLPDYVNYFCPNTITYQKSGDDITITSYYGHTDGLPRFISKYFIVDGQYIITNNSVLIQGTQFLAVEIEIDHEDIILYRLTAKSLKIKYAN